MRSVIATCLFVSLFGCAQGRVDDCRACTDPDSPECAGCLGVSTASDPLTQPSNTANQIAVTSSTLDFAIIGDTRPASVNDTSAYPSAVISQIFQDLQNESPRPNFAVGTGDYQFSSSGSTQTAPQLDLYLQARAAFGNPEYPTMGNHECTGATASNCGPGTTNGETSIYKTFITKMLSPLGVTTPYYSVLVTAADHSWTAKLVFVAANAWTSAQSTWLDTVLAQPTTYTFILRHESSQATTAPGTKPSGQIIAAHPYTMLIVGHDHTYKHMSQKEVMLGNGGAPLTTGSSYGYGVAARRADGAIQFTIYHYKTHAVLDSFAVNADGSPAGSSPPPPPPPTGCAHDLCLSGGKLVASCDPCATQVCGQDSYCCNTSWDSQCVGEVTSVCGQTCGGGGSGSGSGSNGSTCTHDECTTGGKLASGCDTCVTDICSHDSYCCSTGWDATCKAEVGTICGETCP